LNEWRSTGNHQLNFDPFQNVELPDSFSKELKSLLEGLLQRDVDKRLGCKGNG
jgi:hypothetical protein